MNKEKKYAALAIVSLAVGIFITGFYTFLCNNSSKSSVILIEDRSFLSGYQVDGNMVEIMCTISLENDSDVDQRICILGDFQEEVRQGLVKETKLTGIFSDKASDEIMIPAQEKMYDIPVVFHGNFAGTKKMKSRRLPALTVKEIS